MIENRGHLLVLHRSGRDRLHTIGCVHFCLALCSVAALGLMGLVWEAESGTDHTALDAQQLFSPQGNHFGFLWLVAMAFLMVLVPAYAARAYRAGTRIEFDRLAGAVRANGRAIARLDRVEGVTIRSAPDPAGVPIHRLILVHSDGVEWVMHTSYRMEDVGRLAEAIASFLGLERRNRRP